MKYAILLALIINSGCASLSQKAYKKVHVGDTKYALIKKMGHPAAFGPNGDQIEYRYINGRDECVFSLKDDVVSSMACGKNEDAQASYDDGESKFSKAAKGFSEGFNSARSNDPAPVGITPPAKSSYNCTSQVNGNTVNTDCN